MTMTQKILAAHTGLDQVEAGQLIEADVDLILGNDITAPVAIREMERCGACTLFDPEKVVLCWITLRQTRTLSRRSSAKRCAISPKRTAYPTVTM